MLVIDQGNTWIPSGSSAWELSCEKGVRSKANKDYEERITEPMGLEISKATFVFVTPRKWPSKRKWSDERGAEGRWADVRALDADDLVSWLQQTPSVGNWFARSIGKLPSSGFVPLDEWWEHWSTAAKPHISPQLVTAGRGNVIDRIGEWLQDGPSRHYIQGETRDEAIAFLAACASGTSSSWGSILLAKAVVVETDDAWRSLERHSTPLVLVRSFLGSNVSSQIAVKNGHHVITPIDELADAKGNGYKMPRLGLDETIHVLTAMGLSEEKARSLIRKTARRLQIMRRFLIDESGGQQPAWVSRIPQSLVSLVLLGQWEENQEGDRQLVAELVGKPYEEVERELVSLTVIPDPPLVRIGERWRFVSHEEAWHLLAIRVTSSDVNRFQKISTGVFGEVSPAFELPVGERHMANIMGKVLSHSHTLREGMARSLALMGTQADRARNADSVSRVPAKVVSNTLGQRKDWRIWATLNDQLPTLAEATPEAFLDAVECAQSTQPECFKELFAQEGGALLENYHTGLLWALERLAWSQDHFARVAKVLAQLGELDPGGRSSNRPSGSLSSLFLPLIRFSEASDKRRLETLRTLLTTVPMAGWELLANVYPTSSGLVLHRHPPLWQPWAQDGVPRPLNLECEMFVGELEKLLLEYVGSEPARWGDLLGILSALSPETRREGIAKLTDQVDEFRQHPDANKLRNIIRQHLHRHRSYPKAGWAMASKEVEALDSAYQVLMPSDPIEAHGWLFKGWPELPDVDPLDLNNESDDFGKRGEQVAQARLEAVREAYRFGGPSAIIGITLAAEDPFQVGVALARGTESRLAFGLAFEHLGSDNESLRNMALGAFKAFFSLNGWKDLDAAIERLRSDASVPHAFADVYRAAPAAKDTWERLEDENQDVQSAYWKTLTRPNVSDWDSNCKAFVAAKLAAVHRSASAVNWLAHSQLPHEIVIYLLNALQADFFRSVESTPPVHPYMIEHLFEKLDEDRDVPDQLIARLEIPYIAILRHQKRKLALHREVTRDPKLFADLVRLAFKRADGQAQTTSDEQCQRERAEVAPGILWGIPTLPGQLKDGSVDQESLIGWVSEARHLCVERDRKDIGDQEIGRILANSPLGMDGIWPCEPVRDLLDAVASKHIGIGFTIGKRNLRGVTERGLIEGGKKEHSIAAKYRKEAREISPRWPFTASVLREIADAYESEGQFHDQRADWTDQFEL